MNLGDRFVRQVDMSGLAARTEVSVVGAAPSRSGRLGLGDEVAFARFFEAHHADAYWFALGMLGDAARAEDVTSDVIVRAYAKWRRGRIERPDAYLRRAVINEVNSVFRRLGAERRALARHGMNDAPSRPHEDRYADADLLVRALLRLPARQRAAIILRYYEDRSEAETAEILDCAVGTVKSQVHRGITRLRQLVGPHVLPGGDAR